MKSVDIIVLILTICVCMVVIGPAINTAITGESISADKAKIMSGLIVSIIAIISIYVGAKLRGGDE